MKLKTLQWLVLHFETRNPEVRLVNRICRDANLSSKKSRLRYEDQLADFNSEDNMKYIRVLKLKAKS
jgi:hypothetical protein